MVGEEIVRLETRDQKKRNRNQIISGTASLEDGQGAFGITLSQYVKSGQNSYRKP
jgi:hypothetical protein